MTNEINAMSLGSKIGTLLVNRFFKNATWLMGEQILRLMANVFVAIYIARYLGAEQFGVLSYLLALTTFEIAISRLGMESIVVREAVTGDFKPPVVVGTAFGLMLIASVILFLMSTLFFTFAESSPELRSLSYILFLSPLFTAFYVIDFYYQSQLKAKYSAICKSIAIALSSILKLLFIFFDLDVFWFVLAFLFDFAALALMLLLMFALDGHVSYLRKFSSSCARYLLKSAWPMVLTSIAVLIYMKTDQLMIRYFMGMESLGIYTAAIKVYEGWIILPSMLSVSLLPMMVSLKTGCRDAYTLRMTQIFSLVIWLSFIALCGVFVLGGWFVPLLFGSEYLAAVPILNIVMFASVFAALGSVSGRYFTVEGMEKKIAFRMLLSAAINIALNYFLIPVYGLIGAAYSTLFCLFFANYLLDYFDRDLHPLLKMKNRAVFYPINFIFKR
jgi:O-antigen/teichoic acid export membrane protein